MPISRNWRPQDVGLVPGGAHPRAVDLAPAVASGRCPRRCSRRATSRGRGVARAEDAVDHVGAVGRRARRARASTMWAEWPAAAWRSLSFSLERPEAARVALAVVQAQHRGADLAQVGPGRDEVRVSSQAAARQAAGASARVAVATVRMRVSVPSGSAIGRPVGAVTRNARRSWTGVRRLAFRVARRLRVSRPTGCSSAWLERCVWDAEVRRFESGHPDPPKPALCRGFRCFWARPWGQRGAVCRSTRTCDRPRDTAVVACPAR